MTSKNPRSPRVLMVLTSHDRLGETGRATGFYLSEVSHPHQVFSDAGFQVDFASPKGGAAPMDGVNRDDAINAAFLDNSELMANIQNTLPLSEVDATGYDAIFLAGGHGTMWDFPDDADLQAATAAIYERGGIVAALCHGVVGLINVQLADGRYLVDGKEITGFTNDEEKAVELTYVVPLLLESRLRERGASFTGGPNFKSHVVVGDRIATGQNPASASDVARATAELLNA